MKTTLVEATHTMETNLEDDIRHENKLARRHTPKKELEATQAAKAKLRRRHSPRSNFAGDPCPEN